MKHTIPFVHLHVHTEYSLTDATCRISSLISKAQDLGMPALAITDHGTMYGTIEFYRAAKNAGINPIIGCEVYVAPHGRFSRDAILDESPFHLEGFYHKPRIDRELLALHSKGLIGRRAIRECGRVLSTPLPLVNRLARLIPSYITIEHAIESGT